MSRAKTLGLRNDPNVMHKNRIIPYKPELKGLARALRRNSTLSEVLVWRAIKGKALGVEFHRQVPLLEYIVDFYCHELKLAIEIDGNSHDHPETFANDRVRQEKLEVWGVRFVRFSDEHVKQCLEGVVMDIGDAVTALKEGRDLEDDESLA